MTTSKRKINVTITGRVAQKKLAAAFSISAPRKSLSLIEWL